MTPFFINTIRRFILHCKIDQHSATQIGDAVNKYHRQNCPGTHDFDEVMRTADFEGFLVHHQLKFSSVLALNFRVHTQYAALSTPLDIFRYLGSFRKQIALSYNQRHTVDQS